MANSSGRNRETDEPTREEVPGNDSTRGRRSSSNFEAKLERRFNLRIGRAAPCSWDGLEGIKTAAGGGNRDPAGVPPPAVKKFQRNGSSYSGPHPDLEDLAQLFELDLLGAEELDGEVHSLAETRMRQADGAGHDLHAFECAVEHPDADRMRAERYALLR